MTGTVLRVVGCTCEVPLVRLVFLSISKTSFPTTTCTFGLIGPVSEHQDQPATATSGVTGQVAWGSQALPSAS